MTRKTTPGEEAKEFEDMLSDCIEAAFNSGDPAPVMPERFGNGGATATEREAWLAEHSPPLQE